MQIDFHNRKLKLCGGRYEARIFDPAEESETHSVESGNIRVLMALRCKLLPRTERLVKCRTEKPMTKRKDYIFEPSRGDDDRFGAPYSIHSQGAVVGECWIKVVNLGDTEEEWCDGYELGKLCQIKGVCREPREPLKPVTRRGKKNLLDSLKIGQNLTGQQREELRNLLAKFSDVFYTGGPLPLVDVGVEHTVRVKEPATPIACRPRRLDPVSEQEVKRELEKLLEMRVIRQSNSLWAAPVVCARRADGTLRLALDYRKLNEASEPATPPSDSSDRRFTRPFSVSTVFLGPGREGRISPDAVKKGGFRSDSFRSTMGAMRMGGENSVRTQRSRMLLSTDDGDCT